MREIRIPGIRRAFVVGWSDKRLRVEISDEIRFHIGERVEELVRLGHSESEARRRAEQEYGDVVASARELIAVDKRRAGHQHREEIIVSFIEDVRYAARGLLRQPSLLVVTTIALSIGIAANTVMFGVVDQLLVRPPAHLAAPEGLRRVYVRAVDDGESWTSGTTTYPLLAKLMSDVPAMEVVAFSDPDDYSLGSGVDARKVDVQMVSGNFFRVLGVSLAQGRGFAPGEDSIPRGADVAVISDGFRKRDLGDDEALGKVLTLNGVPFTVIGVAPQNFSGVERRNVDVWIPVSAMAPRVMAADWHSAPNSWWIHGFGRLRAGASVEQATAQATGAYRNLIRTWDPRRRPDSTSAIVLGPIVGTRGPEGTIAEGKVAMWLMGVSVIVLLIACANVANLLVARMFQRRREIAVRLALGVSRARLVRMLLAESGLLAAAASVVAVGIALAASPLVQKLLLPGIVWSDSVLDRRVLAFTLAITVLCILAAGVAPAFEGLKTRLSETLTASSRPSVGRRNRLRFALLVVQGALSVLLLIGAGLFVRSLRNVAARDVGIDLDRVLLVTMDLDRLNFARPQIEEIYRRAHGRLLAVPSVGGASVVRQSVPSKSGNGMRFSVPGISRYTFPGGGPYYSVVAGDFFGIMGTAQLRGRTFTSDESTVPSRSMIVNRIVAEAYWPGRDPIGQCARLGSDTVCSTIVGVVENVMLFRLVKDDRAMLYLPPGHASFGKRPPAAVVVRANSDPRPLIPLIQKEVQALAPNMPFVSVEPYSQRVAPQLRPWRLGATMFTVFGGIALLIATVGLYSVLAFWVSQRTHEIGVRMALGAQRGDVVRLVAAQTMQAIGFGLVLGIAAAALAARWVGDLLYETAPRDPVVYGLAAGALAISALIASVVPARRSSSVDPSQALRAN